MTTIQPKVRVKIWDGTQHGRDKPEERDLVFGEVFAQTSDLRMGFGPAQFVVGAVFANGGFHQRRAR